MRLSKRIEKLELLQKQTDCSHSYHNLHIEEQSGTHFKVKSACWRCGKEISRSSFNDKMAVKDLYDFLVGKVEVPNG